MIFTRWASRPASIQLLGPSPTQATPADSSNDPDVEQADDSEKRPLPSKNKNIYPWAEGKYHFYDVDAKQWAAWGFDYLKYDWNPIIPEQVDSMGQALKNSGRDFTQLIQQRPVRRRRRLGQAFQLMANHRRHPRHLAQPDQQRLFPKQMGRVRRSRPLERPRYACRRHGRLGPQAPRHRPYL